jgi:uncharacterized membrane protein (DUF106 family)
MNNQSQSDKAITFLVVAVLTLATISIFLVKIIDWESKSANQRYNALQSEYHIKELQKTANDKHIESLNKHIQLQEMYIEFLKNELKENEK